MEKVKQCCNKEYLKENCPCVKAERQRIKKEIEILKDVDIGCNDKGCLSCHIKRCSYNRVLEVLEGEK